MRSADAVGRRRYLIPEGGRANYMPTIEKCIAVPLISSTIATIGDAVSPSRFVIAQVGSLVNLPALAKSDDHVDEAFKLLILGRIDAGMLANPTHGAEQQPVTVIADHAYDL